MDLENFVDEKVDSDLKFKYEEYLKSQSCSYKMDYIPIVYWDDDGNEKVFLIDFYVQWDFGLEEWVECVPHKDLRPVKKYLFAKKISESHDIIFRGLKEEEIKKLL